MATQTLHVRCAHRSESAIIAPPASAAFPYALTILGKESQPECLHITRMTHCANARAYKRSVNAPAFGYACIAGIGISRGRECEGSQS